MTTIGESIRPGAALLRPTDVADYFDVDVETVNRWRRKGVWVGTGTDRRRVRLNGLRVGGCWRVPPAAVDEFLAARNPAEPAEPVTREVTPAETREFKAAMTSLAAHGLGAG